MDRDKIQEIISRVRSRLSQLAQEESVRLCVEEEGTTYEDDWLYILVEPDSDEVRASDYAEAMTKIEKELRADGIQHVLLVPARHG